MRLRRRGESDLSPDLLEPQFFVPDEGAVSRAAREVPVAYEGCVVADSDLHVMERPDLWQRYIDPAFRHAAPVGLSEWRRDMRMRVKNRIVLRGGAVRPMRTEAVEGKTGWRPEHDAVYAAADARGWDAQSEVDAMDAEGVDLAVLFPSRGLFVLGLDSVEMMGNDGLEPDFAAAIARAYNDWLHEFCQAAPDMRAGSCATKSPSQSV